MSDQEEVILEQQAGSIGGIDARIICKLLPSNAFQVEMEIETSESNVRSAVQLALAQLGTIIGAASDKPPQDTVSAMIKSGFLNMNPAHVVVTITASSEGLTQVQIIGTAKEGLIKQQGGESAAKRVAAALLNALAVHSAGI